MSPPRDYLFCGNPHCPLGLHVRPGDADVDGSGSWATLENGLVIGRGLYNGAYLCDPCGKSADSLVLP